MSLLDKIHMLLSRSPKSDGRIQDTVDVDGLGELAHKLTTMRGRKVRSSGGKVSREPNRDGIKNLTSAARDMRTVNWSSEDKTLDGIKSYRDS